MLYTLLVAGEIEETSWCILLQDILRDYQIIHFSPGNIS